jgi:type VI secretion system FHA domain protein
VIDPFGSPAPPGTARGAFDPFDQQRPVNDQFGQKEVRQGAAAGGDVLRRPVLESEPREALPEGEATPDILDLVGRRDADSDLMAPAAGGAFPRSPDFVPSAARDADGLLAGDKRLEFDEIESDAGGARHDHTPQEDAFFRPPEAIPDDYDLLGADTEIEPGASAEDALLPESAASDEELDLGGVPAPADLEGAEPTYADDEVAPPPERPRPPRHEARPPESVYQPARDDRAVAAFMAGLGYRDQTSPIGNTAEVMETAGALLRAMTEGLISVMRSRSSFKSELRIEMTTIQSVENNPFKFSVNADDALDNLLFRRTKGFLSPVYAANQAYEDVQAHEMAMLAGLRAMLRALLLRFDPSKLEERFGKEASIANRLPMVQKAKCWDYLTGIYTEVAADAGDDFQRLFGDAFTRAYEEQVQRLKKGRGHKADG